MITTLIAVPFFAAVATVLFYCVYKSWLAALFGGGITLIGWFVFACWYQQYTTPARANPTVYNQLLQSLAGLKLKSRQICLSPHASKDEKELFADFHKRICLLEELLYCRKGDLRWVSAIGYLNAWAVIHRLDEDLIKFDSPRLAREDVQSDRLRLSDSTIPGHQAMLEKLDVAAKLIAPITAIVSAAAAKEAPDKDAPATTASKSVPEETLLDLVTVRKTISDFRDNQRIGLVEARNRLGLVGIITGLTLDLLVGLAVAFGVSQSRLATAGAFFLAGAVIGIFRRLYEETQSNSEVEDYSLSTTRTIVVPMVSGIAGLFGVLLILIPGALNGSLPIIIPAPTNPPASVTAASSATNANPATLTTATAPGPTATAVPTMIPAPIPPNLPTRTATLDDLFNIEHYPLVLIVAAIFGYAPSLFVSKLQRQAEEYKQGLKKSA